MTKMILVAAPSQLYIYKNGDDELQSQQLWLLSSKTKNTQAAEAAQASTTSKINVLINRVLNFFVFNLFICLDLANGIVFKTQYDPHF